MDTGSIIILVICGLVVLGGIPFLIYRRKKEKAEKALENAPVRNVNRSAGSARDASARGAAAEGSARAATRRGDSERNI